MKKIFTATVALAALAIVTLSAQAAITIDVAEVQNGVAFIKGNGAERRAQIFWDGTLVTKANNNNGGFSFNGAVPSDCIGELSDGVETFDVQVFACTPAGGAGVPAPVAKTGQTGSSATGDDGDLEKGVASPDPRFTDNSDGTITDNLTGLIWLKNANCPGGTRDWQTALNDVASLNLAGTMNSNNCGDTSNAGSHQTDWRLPNVRELQSLVDYGTFNRPLPADNPFTNFQASSYWSSTTCAFNSDNVWNVDFGFFGGDVRFNGKIAILSVTAVRGGS